MDMGAIMRFVSNKYGRGYLNAPFYTKVNEWFEWYQGYIEKLHQVTHSNGLTIQKRKIYRLKMAKRVCEDWASAVLNEDVKIVVNAVNNKSSVFVQGTKGGGGVLGSNKFTSKISRAMELMFALGTSAFVLNLDNIQVNADTGDIMGSLDTKIKIDMFNAMQILPLSYTNDDITEAAFVSELSFSGKTYYLVSVHVRDAEGFYEIYNDILDDSYNSASLNFGVLAHIRTMSKNPFFFIFKTNIVNNLDLNSPMGISIYSEATDNLLACDTVYDSCIRDVITGQRIVMMNKCLLTTDDAGLPVVPQDVKQSYMQFFGDDATSTINEYIKEFAPDLNTEQLDLELQNQLNMLSSKVGLGTKFYNFNIASGVTATEYIGERNDMFRNIGKLTESIASTLKEMVQQILWLGKNVVGANVDDNAKVVVDVSDGIIESDEKKREQDRQDVKDKLMSRVEYRMKWYGETEAEAKQALTLIDGEGISVS